MITSLVIGAIAVIVYAWPENKITTIIPNFKKSQKTFGESIAALTHVQSRLVETAEFDDEQKEAIDVLTLALVRGSQE